MLPAPWYADDRNAKQQSEEQVRNRDPDTTAENPDDIEYRGYTACRAGNVPYLATEWHQGKDGDLKTLKTEWDANNGEAKDKAAYQVFDAGN